MGYYDQNRRLDRQREGDALQIQVVGLHSPRQTPDQLSGAVLQAVEALEQGGWKVQGRCTCQLSQLPQAAGPALERGETVLVVGGASIDPNVRQVLEDWLRLPTGFDPATDQRVRAAYAQVGRPLPESAQLLSQFPRGATILPGIRTILPGCLFSAGGGTLVLLPARPEEFLPMLQRGLFPLWSQSKPSADEPDPPSSSCSKLVNVWGVSEQALSQRLEDLSPPEGVSLQVIPLPGGLGVRVSCEEGCVERPQSVCELVAQQVSLLLGEAACGFDQEAGPAGIAAQALFDAGRSVALGESGTNGLLAGQLQPLPNARKVLPFSVSAYSDRLRQDALLVPAKLLKKYGAQSAQTAAAMALGAMQQGGASLGLAICCPTGEDPDPCWVALCDGETVWTRQEPLPSRREEPESARLQACQAGLRLLLDYLANPGGLPGGQTHRQAVDGMLPSSRAAKTEPPSEEPSPRGRGALRIAGILLVLAGLGAAGWLGITQGMPLLERMTAASASTLQPEVETLAAQTVSQAQELSAQAHQAQEEAAQAALDAQYTISAQKARAAANTATQLNQQADSLYHQARQVRDQAEELLREHEGETTMAAYETAQRALKAAKECLDTTAQYAGEAQTAALGTDLVTLTLSAVGSSGMETTSSGEETSSETAEQASSQTAAEASSLAAAQAASQAAAQAASEAAAQAAREAAAQAAASKAAAEQAAAQAASQAAASRAEVASRIAAEQAAIREEALEADVWESEWEQAESEEDEDEEFQPSGSGNDRLTIYANGKRTTGKATEIVAMVVMNEMGSSFQMEALKAQAVAVYTYIKHQNAGGVTPSFNTRTPNSTVQSAVNAVAGEAVYYRGSLAFTPFFATSAGVTVSSAEVWGGSYPYLVSVDSEIDEEARNYEMEVTMDADTVADRVDRAMDEDLWDYSDDPDDWFEIEGYTDGGRYVARIRVGNEVVSGRYLRENVLGLRSAAFDIDCDGEEFTFTTYGYGHGVGMSQTGADLYASEEGWDYVDILTHYYPGTQVG